MTTTSLPIAERLAVCSWSLQPKSARDLVGYMQEIGLSRVQIALDPLRLEPDAWRDMAASFAQHGMTIVSGMMVTEGEDYSTMERIRETGGIVPDGTWETNWRHFQTNARLARDLGLDLVTLHAGFLPEDTQDPQYAKLARRLGQTVDLFAEHGIAVGLETGQETAEDLGAFLHALGRTTVGVNFDPANMILYDKGDPIAALKTLAPWVKQCHIKDAIRTRQPGTWGEEVATGSGEVDWPAFFRTAREIGYQGWFAIEREAGEQRLADIKTARAHVETLS